MKIIPCAWIGRFNVKMSNMLIVFYIWGQGNDQCMIPRIHWIQQEMILVPVAPILRGVHDSVSSPQLCDRFGLSAMAPNMCGSSLVYGYPCTCLCVPLKKSWRNYYCIYLLWHGKVSLQEDPKVSPLDSEFHF